MPWPWYILFSEIVSPQKKYGDMFYQYEPNVQATIAFLKLHDIKVTGTTVNETLLNHPDWPSLYSISDSLNKWNIPNAGGKIETSNIDSLPCPFFAFIHQPENPVVVVEDITENDITSYVPNKGRKTQPLKDFLKYWNGVYLIAEPGEHAGDPFYKSSRRKEILNVVIPGFFFTILLFFVFSAFSRSMYGSAQQIATWFLFGIQLLGTFVTSLLLWYELDRNNPLLSKVCTGIRKGNCSAILTSKAARIFRWLSWSEVGFFYFTGGLLLLALSTDISASLPFLTILNLLALPYIFFSIYYQWRVEKQWCILCLAVQAMLFSGGIIIISAGLYKDVSHLSMANLVYAFLVYAIPVFFWSVTKPYLKKLQHGKNLQREYMRIKFNTEIFETLLKKQKQILGGTDRLGIDLGNPHASNKLVKVCNPYCGPCAAAHPKIEKLLEEIPDLSAKIIFVAANDKESITYKPVSHLLAIAEKNDSAIIKEALDDWYMAKEKDYTDFAKKYPMNGELQQQGDKVDDMEEWCTKAEIKFTPTIFINGFQLPDAYSIEDLKYFLSE